jgi:hypothetical protein
MILPLLWSEEPSVADAAASGVARLLRDPDLRASFDAGSLTPYEVPPAARTPLLPFVSWAVPWLDEAKATVRLHYCRVIHLLAARLYGSPLPEPTRATLAAMPGDLRVPVLITLGHARINEIQHVTEAARAEGATTLSAALRMDTDAVRHAIGVLLGIPGERHRSLWARAIGERRPDIAIDGRVPLIAFGMALLACLTAPAAYAAWAGTASAWWLAPVGVMTVASLGAGAVSRDSTALLLLAAIGLGPSVAHTAMRPQSRPKAGEWLTPIVCGLAYVSSAAGAIVTGGAIGTGVAAFTMLTALTPIENGRMVLWRRDNPLLDLRQPERPSFSPAFGPLESGAAERAGAAGGFM